MKALEDALHSKRAALLTVGLGFRPLGILELRILRLCALSCVSGLDRKALLEDALHSNALRLLTVTVLALGILELPLNFALCAWSFASGLNEKRRWKTPHSKRAAPLDRWAGSGPWNPGTSLELCPLRLELCVGAERKAPLEDAALQTLCLLDRWAGSGLES
ncbi:MAG: hypothetical protein HS113_14730 [Verrucomicrobiales bacterium]|nr:hypothetical protein [Verrucomicrobiales bacterium]